MEPHGEAIRQVDAYLNHPSRNFAQTGEAFRIRRVGDANAITYKGPKLAGPTKTRRNSRSTSPLGPKRRNNCVVYSWLLGSGQSPRSTRCARPPPDLPGRPNEVVLDDVDELGPFVEVEAIASDDADLAAAQSAVIGLSHFSD